MCGWHSDSHPQLGRNPPVASVSLGAVRVFELRKKKVKSAGTGTVKIVTVPQHSKYGDVLRCGSKF
jgi:hypothetical protein